MLCIVFCYGLFGILASVQGYSISVGSRDYYIRPSYDGEDFYGLTKEDQEKITSSHKLQVDTAGQGYKFGNFHSLFNNVSQYVKTVSISPRTFGTAVRGELFPLALENVTVSELDIYYCPSDIGLNPEWILNLNQEKPTTSEKFYFKYCKERLAVSHEFIDALINLPQPTSTKVKRSFAFSYSEYTSLPRNFEDLLRLNSTSTVAIYETNWICEEVQWLASLPDDLQNKLATNPTSTTYCVDNDGAHIEFDKWPNPNRKYCTIKWSKGKCSVVKNSKKIGKNSWSFPTDFNGKMKVKQRR